MNFIKVSIYFLLMIVSSLCAFAQNPLRKVVFTLNENESIVSNEYYLMQQFNKNRFACMVYDNVRKKSTFIFNGKRIKTGNFPPEYADALKTISDISQSVVSE